jgi:hypothetical protein
MAGWDPNWARTSAFAETKSRAFAGLYRFSRWAVLGSNQPQLVDRAHWSVT